MLTVIPSSHTHARTHTHTHAHTHTHTHLLARQKEELDECNVQVSPPGFHVVFLPFAEDLRKLQFEEDTPRGLW